MRQLDLFASVFDTPPQEKKTEETRRVLKKKEDNLSVSKPEEINYSVVELAEAALGENTNNCEEQISGKDKPEEDTTKHAEAKPDLISSENKNKEEYLLEKNPAEEIKIDITVSTANTDAPKKNAASSTEEHITPIPERNGAVIFDNGKIAVKVKSKPVITAEVVKEEKEVVKEEKEKKEPQKIQKRGRKPIKEIEAEADLIEVPEDEVLFQKQYYPISEVAKWFRVNTSLLRFWENEFDILKPKKNRKGDRLFRPEDVKNLQLIYQLLRQRKYTIEGAKEYIKTNKKKADMEMQLTNTLQKFKSFLLDLKANLTPNP